MTLSYVSEAETHVAVVRVAPADASDEVVLEVRLESEGTVTLAPTFRLVLDPGTDRERTEEPGGDPVGPAGWLVRAGIPLEVERLRVEARWASEIEGVERSLEHVEEVPLAHPAPLNAEAPVKLRLPLEKLRPAQALVFPGSVFVPGLACPGPAVLEHTLRVIVETVFTPGAPLSIFSHTRERGDDAADKALADRRAEVVAALLTQDLETFDAVAEEEAWPLRCYQAMLRAVGCNPGRPDGVEGPLTRAAAESFQREYNAGVYHEYGRAPTYSDIAEDGALSEETLAALRDAFLSVALWNESPLSEEQFVDVRCAGCAGLNMTPDADPRGRVEVALYTEPPPAEFPCTPDDLAACAVDREFAPRCRFYRDTVAHAEEGLREPFFDLEWLLEDDGQVFLSAVTTLPDDTPVELTVYRATSPLPPSPPSSARTAERPTPGPELARLAATIEAGVCWARWTPPSDYDPFDWSGWLVDFDEVEDVDALEEQVRLEPPVFALDASLDGVDQWAFSHPPGRRLSRLRFTSEGEVPGAALLNDGQVVTFDSVDGLVRDHGGRVVAVQLDGHVVEGGEAE